MKNTKIIALAVAVLSSTLAGCFHDDDDEPAVSSGSYEIVITNISNNQPLTPAAVILHKSGYSPWELGATASTGLEELAESGSPDNFLLEADANTNVSATETNGAVFGPGASATINVTAKDISDLKLSVASMLANTNDGFSGVSGLDISELKTGDSMTVLAKVFDAGTEVNDESNIPGPAADGEGFTAARETLDKVTIHSGVVTMDDGLSTSALNESHRWQTYAAKVVIIKTQ